MDVIFVERPGPNPNYWQTSLGQYGPFYAPRGTSSSGSQQTTQQLLQTHATPIDTTVEVTLSTSQGRACSWPMIASNLKYKSPRQPYKQGNMKTHREFIGQCNYSIWHWSIQVVNTWGYILLFFFFSFFFFFFFWATPVAYGISQARSWIGAVSAGLCHSHSSAGSLTHWVGLGIKLTSSWILIGIVTAEPQQELLKLYS